MVTVAWNDSTHPSLPSGAGGPVVAGYSVRYQINGGAWTAWTPAQDASLEVSGVSVGTSVNIQARATNNQGSQSSVGSANLTIAEVLEDPMVADMAATSYAERYGTTLQVARAWITVQFRSSTIQDAVRSSSSGAGFGGAWYDNTARKLVVNLKNGTDSTGAQTALNTAGVGPDSRIAIVRNTLTELKNGYLAISNQLEDLQLAGLISMSSDDSANRVVITQTTSMTTDQRNRVAQAAAASAVQVSIVQGTNASYADGVVDALCGAFPTYSPDYPESAYPYGPAFCSSPLRGGVDIFATAAGVGQGRCSAGLMARGKNTANPFLLTSGHCIRRTGGRGRSWSATAYELPLRDEKIGTSGDWEDDKNRDHGIISIDAGYWRTPIRPIILTRGRNGETRRRDRMRIRAVEANRQGETICTSGGNTGGHCGDIIAVGRDTPGEGGTQWATFNACEPGRKNPIRGGDSGAPVFTQTGAARGIIKGWLDEDRCIAIFQSAVLAADDLDVEILTR